MLLVVNYDQNTMLIKWYRYFEIQMDKTKLRNIITVTIAMVMLWNIILGLLVHCVEIQIIYYAKYILFLVFTITSYFQSIDLNFYSDT